MTDSASESITKVTSERKLSVKNMSAFGFEGNPEAVEEAGKVVADLMERGIMIREGNEEALSNLTFFEGFHDKIAKRTA